MNPKLFLSSLEQKNIREKINAIENALHTKIAIHIEKNHKGNLYDAALKAFSKNKLHHEKIKTGILLFLSIESRQFQLLGDQHVHEKIGNEGWKQLANTLSQFFKEGKFYEGIMDLLDKIDQSDYLPRR